MAPSLQTLGIDQWPIEQRIALARELWDNIEADEHPPLLTEVKRRELERRLKDHEANPNNVVPWEQIRDEALARFGR